MGRPKRKLIVSQTEYARLRGIDQSQVSKWIKRGLITLGPDGIDIDIADAALAARAQVYRGGQVGGNRSKAALVADLAAVDRGEAPPVPPVLPDVPPSPSGSTARAVALKEHYLALLRQVEYDEKVGLVVPIETVAHELAAEYAAIRNLVLGMAAKLAPRVIACRTAGEAEAVIRTECEQVLRTLSEDEPE